MAEFLWIEWNLQKIDNHALSQEEVEFAWENREDVKKGIDPAYGPFRVSRGRCPSGRTIMIVWRMNEVDDREMVFVITAY